MKTSQLILDLLAKSNNPLSAKEIATQLNQSSGNIRATLTRLCEQGLIKRVAYGLYESVTVKENTSNLALNESVTKSVTLPSESVTVLSDEDELIRAGYRAYYRKYKALHPEKLKAYYRKYRELHSEKFKEYNKKYRALHPEKFKEYQRRFWIKKGLLALKGNDENNGL